MVLFLEPIFKERLWGGKGLESFNYHLPNNNIGECWAISAHPHGANMIENGKHKGEMLDQVWSSDKELFGNDERDKFPLLTKILDANDKLSVQVHPDDTFALEHEGEYGKTECWYILSAEEDAEIIYGVNVDNKEDLKDYIDDKKFDQLFRRIRVKAGDFYYVPAGTVHAIGSGIMILETQQSSDTTYRIYDYQRKDKQGKLRELHLEQSKKVIDINQKNPNIIPQDECYQGQKVTHFVSNEFFTVAKWEVDGILDYAKPNVYCLVSIIDGKGTVTIDNEKYSIQKGRHFILTNDDCDIVFKGDIEFIVSYA